MLFLGYGKQLLSCENTEHSSFLSMCHSSIVMYLSEIALIDILLWWFEQEEVIFYIKCGIILNWPFLAT